MAFLAVKRLVLSACRRLGYDITRWSPPEAGQRRLLSFVWQQTGLTRVIDGGAGRGAFTTLVLERNPRAEVVPIEPLSEQAEAYCRCHPQFASALQKVALGEHSETRCFYRTASADSSSLFPPSAHATHFPLESTVAREEMVPVQALDDLRGRGALAGQSIDLLKLDLQGAELLALRGARHTLTETSFILAEVSLLPLYGGAPRLDETIVFLSQSGFQVVDGTDASRSRATNETVQLDLLFRRVGAAPTT
jgi:FkbM family methyltransferase